MCQLLGSGVVRPGRVANSQAELFMLQELEELESLRVYKVLGVLRAAEVAQVLEVAEERRVTEKPLLRELVKVVRVA